MQNQPTSKEYSVTKSAFRVMLGGIFSLFAGLAVQMITASLFGAGAEMDAYLTAQVIPVYLQWVLLGGLSFVLIPAFVELQTRGKEDDAWSMTGTSFWITALILTILAGIGAVFAPQLVSRLAPGFGASKMLEASRMLQLLMLSIPFSGLAALTVSIQNARNHFFWPAMATAIGSAGNAVCLVLLYPRMGSMALAWGYLISVIFQAIVTIVPVFRHGWKRLMRLTDPRILELGRLVWPFVIFNMLSFLPSVFERTYASVLPDGQISYLGYAYKIANIFVVLLASGIASAIFPAMARGFNLQGVEGLAFQTDYGMRLTLAVALPAVLILTVLSVPLIRILYQRGAFFASDTLHVSRAILAVMLGEVLFRMISNVLSRSLYVMKDTLTPPIVGSLGAVLYIATGQFFANHWQYLGLAWIQTLQKGVAILGILIILHRKLPGFRFRKFGRTALFYGGLAGAAALSSWLILLATSTLQPVFQLCIGALGGLAVYFGLLYLFDPATLTSILEMFGVSRFVALIKPNRSANRIPSELIHGK